MTFLLHKNQALQREASPWECAYLAYSFPYYENFCIYSSCIKLVYPKNLFSDKVINKQGLIYYNFQEAWKVNWF